MKQMVKIFSFSTVGRFEKADFEILPHPQVKVKTGHDQSRANVSLFFINEREGGGESQRGCGSRRDTLVGIWYTCFVYTKAFEGAVQIFTGWLPSSWRVNPLEDANSTTDKLAQHNDDTCKMGRQGVAFLFKFDRTSYYVWREKRICISYSLDLYHRINWIRCLLKLEQ